MGCRDWRTLRRDSPSRLRRSESKYSASVPTVRMLSPAASCGCAIRHGYGTQRPVSRSRLRWNIPDRSKEHRSAPTASTVVAPTVSADGAIRVWDARTGDTLHLPIRGRGKEHFAVFSMDGHSLLAVDGSSLEIEDMPPHEVPPSWVADLADFAATQTNYDQSRLPDLPKIHALSAQLLSSSSNDPWTLFGKWYFADSGRRTLSPWSQISLESYVRKALLIERGDRKSTRVRKIAYLTIILRGWQRSAPLLAKLPSQSIASK